MGARRIKIRTKKTASRSSGQSNTLTVVRFEIPKGRLQDVAKAFEAATGRRVVFDNDDLLDIGSPGISGQMTVDAALRQMLAETGVSARSEGAAIFLEVRLSFRVEVLFHVAGHTANHQHHSSVGH